MDAHSWETGQLLFVYGSLLLPTGDAPVDDALSSHSRPLATGYIHACLYDLGDYPGAKPYASPSASPPGDGPGPPKVRGRVIGLADPDAVFAVLDAYEGFDSRSPSTSEFVRTAAAVILPETGRTLTAQVYFYNPPVEGKTPIPSGDYLTYRQAKETRR